MELNEYQTQAKSTAVYRGKQEAVFCTLMGLNGEAGEVAEKFKKLVRDGDKGLDALVEISPQDREAIVKELGDVLWYLSVLADSLDVKLEEVASQNLLKLRDRFNRGQIRGSGDQR